MNQLEVEASQVQRPLGLATVEFLSHHEVLQVLVVHPDFYQVPGSFQISTRCRAPSRKCLHSSSAWMIASISR